MDICIGGIAVEYDVKFNAVGDFNRGQMRVVGHVPRDCSKR